MTGDERIGNDDVLEDEVTFDLKAVRDLGCVSEEREIYGYKVKLQTLSVGEEDMVLRELNDIMNAVERFHHTQKWTLVYATKRFNDKDVTTEKDVKKLVKFYFSLQSKVLSEFYRFYLELAGKQNEILDELKKK